MFKVTLNARITFNKPKTILEFLAWTFVERQSDVGLCETAILLDATFTWCSKHCSRAACTVHDALMRKVARLCYITAFKHNVGLF